MAFNTNLQMALQYLKAGHPVVPNMQAIRQVPQFTAQMPVVPQRLQLSPQGLQGTMPVYGPH